MGFLQDKKILVTGLLSNRSIAYGIAKALKREGATLAFTYQNEDIRQRVTQLAQEFGVAPILRCDVSNDAEIDALFEQLAKEWDGLDGIVHSIAYTPREALRGELLDGLTREATTFYDYVVHLAFDDGKVPKDVEPAMKTVMTRVVELLQDTIGVIDFWAKHVEVRKLRGRIDTEILLADVPALTARHERIAVEIVKLAEKRHQELLK